MLHLSDADVRAMPEERIYLNHPTLINLSGILDTDFQTPLQKEKSIIFGRSAVQICA